ncbi:uncharacterized protein LOC110436768 [Sorghum bicolor]|uniref:uncharacterized protein LOC8067534 n=1 Tax=Sorghum bicolor TaxID=4558 RepID=UPI000B426D0A|nr:uncharacterized protein LOC8067534 [Sorghum bicolor]XP_021319927.1 uncharacterized protein LOC110436768 [Sorghum bicolor]|eukprot:XP_021315244.1 uncharacterized protein LOC8067534 [Sorghum bicolor]
MTKAMGRRLPIVVDEGNTRPHEPVQAAKFASEAGVIVRESMPVLTHWKEYKKTDKYYNDFVGQLCGRLAINKEDKPTEEACTDMLRSAVKNQRYRLKQKYFNGIPANEVRTTSPVEYMTDAEWRALVAKWSDPKNMETCEKNKRNRSKVKYHQATGSRCYVAHLHAYKQKRNREEPSADLTEELDAVEAFQTCHTSSKKGLTEPAREALLRMEALRSEPVAEGVAPASSVEVVSKVLSHNSSHQFLKSVGIKTPASSKSSSSNESELREQLAAEAAAAVQGELDELKKKSQEAEEKLARTQIELEEYKKLTERNTKEMEETNLILKKLLSLHSNASSI